MRDGTQVRRVATYLEQSPGYHKPSDVARATGMDSHQACVALRYLYEKGQIDRQRITLQGHRHPTGFYATIKGKVQAPSRQPWKDKA